MARPTLSLVIPIFNEEQIIPELDRRLRAFLADVGQGVGESWEVVFIDDGSRDRSREMLRELAAREPRYRVIGLSRNFGHQLAITAGIDRADGEAVVVMDADLQDPPEVVRDMLGALARGLRRRLRRARQAPRRDLVQAAHGRALLSLPARDAGREDPGRRRRLPTDEPSGRADAARAARAAPVRARHGRLGRLQADRGDVRAPGRFAGETKYPFRKMLRFAIDGITSFSIIPLRFATWLGVLSGFAAIGVGIWAFYVKVFGSAPCRAGPR